MRSQEPLAEYEPSAVELAGERHVPGERHAPGGQERRVEHTRGTAGLPRLLAGIPARGALSLEHHLALHGGLPAAHERGWTRARRGDSALIDEIERAGLLGRGGAAFPTAAKLRAVAAAARTTIGRARPLVVVNAAEGEPASAKDRTLLRSLPHLVLDGALLAARAVGSREVLVGLCQPASHRSAAAAAASSSASVSDTLAHALAERRSLDRRTFAGAIDVQLHPVPHRYVAGHESSLVNHLSGGPALPTFTPPRPFERGVNGRPTLVCNVETLAHLALIARYGAHWFRELGTPEQPGSALLTLSGPVAHPGVYEIEHGSSLESLLDAAGGATAAVRALLLGGYSGAWVDSSWLPRLALCNRQLEPYGASVGAGVVVALSADACPIAELARLTHWLAAQSARQCGPCLHGLDAIAAVLGQLTSPAALDRHGAERRLRALASLVYGRGACSHPDGAARMVTSAVNIFAEELSQHIRRGPCAACSRPSELPFPAHR